MAPKAVWGDFVSTGVVRHAGKFGSRQDEEYDTWRCPHCEGTVEMIVSTQNRKSMACAAHFWNTKAPCPKRPETDLRGKKVPKPKHEDAPAVVIELPVVGEPLEAQDPALQQELAQARLELARERIISERCLQDSERCRQERDDSDKRLNEERILSEQYRRNDERHKRERNECYQQARVRSPHSSDGEDGVRLCKEEFVRVVTAAASVAASAATSAATSAAEAAAKREVRDAAKREFKKQRRQSSNQSSSRNHKPSFRQYAEQAMRDEYDYVPPGPSTGHGTGQARKSSTGTSRSTASQTHSGDDFKQLGTDLKAVASVDFTHRQLRIGFHSDKHLGPTEAPAKRLMDALNAWNN